MHTQPEDFRAETVDEQVEQLLLVAHNRDAAPAVSVVQDLQGLYAQIDSPEQVRRSLDTIWSRLADHISPENQTMRSMPTTGPLRAIPGDSPMTSNSNLAARMADGEELHNENWIENDITTLPRRPMHVKAGKRHLRRTLALSALAAIVLLSVLSWALVTRLGPPSGQTGAGPGRGGTVVPTIPPTPAPQSLRDQAQQLLKQFHTEVTTWGSTHQYHDAFDGKNYALDYAYDHQGIGGVLDKMLSQAKSSADYHAAISSTQDELTNLHALENDAADQTPWSQAHSADTSLLSHYKLNAGTVVVISLVEQSLRVYQNGQLVEAFQITSGRYERPTLPGSWSVETRQSPTTLMSSEPKGSPYWYPPTNVKYAIMFHSGGYLLIDGWWRANFGSNTQFPHHDGSGNTGSNNGSLGTIDLATADMAWLYAHVQINTPVVIY